MPLLAAMKWLGVTWLAGMLAIAGAPGATPPPQPPPIKHAAEESPVMFTGQQFAKALLVETNRVRRLEGRSRLEGWDRLDAAADDQAWYSAVRFTALHSSELAKEGTPLDRVRRHNVEPAECAENAASTPVDVDGRILSGPEIVHALIAAWMNSPGHRANLLNRDMTHFGGAVRIARTPTGAWYAYGIQVFVRLPAMQLE